MTNYTHIFFDLDHTLWDFEKNSRTALSDIFEDFIVDKYNIQLTPFLKVFHDMNAQLWYKLNHGKIDKDYIRNERFKLVFYHFNIQIDQPYSDLLTHRYLATCPYNKQLMPNCIDVLEYLTEKGYRLNIITNGFEEIQDVKLRTSNIDRFFDHVITSGNAMCKKPDPRIFEYALDVSGGTPETSLMIGDDLNADVLGAKRANMDQVHYLQKEENSPATYIITDLAELKTFL